MDRRTHFRRLPPLAVVLLRVLAVCLLGGLGALWPVVGQAQSGPSWSPPAVLYDDAAYSFKTALISDQFGAAHLVWEAPDEPTYYYSRWNGVGWTAPADVIATTGDVESLGVPALVAAVDGKLHLFWAQDRIMHSWARADAASSARAWSAPEAVIFPNGSTAGPMDVKQDRSGVFHLVYAAGMGDIYYARSDDGGTTWSEPAAVSSVPPDTIATAPRLDIGPDGRVHVVWTEYPVEAGPTVLGTVHYAHTTDDGESWSDPRQLGGLADINGNVLAAENGTVYLAWQAGIASASEGRFVQRSTDGGETWEAPINFGKVKAQSGYPGMALDGAGTLHIITGDGEYVWWDGRSLSPPLDLRPLPEQTENSRLGVVAGNQVLAVVMPFHGPGIYYLVRQLPMPALPTAKPTRTARDLRPAQPLATATLAPMATTEAIATMAATATVAVANAGTFPAARPTPFTVPVLPFSVGLSLALVAAVVIIQVSRRGR